jgi:hypothetical protein
MLMDEIHFHGFRECPMIIEQRRKSEVLEASQRNSNTIFAF